MRKAARGIVAALVATTPAVARAQAATPPGFVEVASGTRLHLSGYAQVDWVVANQSSIDEVNGATGESLNEKRFLLRRGHLRADAERGLVSAALEIDANTIAAPIVRPIDTEVTLRWPAHPAPGEAFVAGTLGLMKIPFGFEVPEGDEVRPFLERTTAARGLFAGNYDLGARVRGGFRAVDWQLAIMNGEPIGERGAFAGRDPNQSKDLVGRVGAHGDLARGRVKVEAGISGLTGGGFHEGTPSTKDTLVWRDTNEDGQVQPAEIQVIPGSSATPSERFSRFALGADLRVKVTVPVLGELAVRGEIVRAKNLDRALFVADPVSAGRDVRELGWYVGATQEVTSWALVGVRYDRYDPDADVQRLAGVVQVASTEAVTTLSLLAMLRYESLRLSFQYDHEHNALGRDANGAPANLADDTAVLRGQVVF